MYSGNPGFVYIDSSQYSDGQNQNQGSGFPAQEFIKRTFSLCIKRSLAVISRWSPRVLSSPVPGVSCTRFSCSLFSCTRFSCTRFSCPPFSCARFSCPLLSASSFWRCLKASLLRLRRGRLSSLRLVRILPCFFLPSCTFTFLSLPTVSPPGSPHIL